MNAKITLIIFLISGLVQAQDPYLTYVTKDSINGMPKLKSSLGVNMKLNGYYDAFGGLQNSETFNVGYIDVFGTDDTDSFHLDMYQTQVYLKNTYLTDEGKIIKAVVEADFWGGNGQVRLRKAYFETEHWQIGQNWNNFGDEVLWPNIMEWEGPPSGVWIRTPHIKYMNTFYDTKWNYSISLEAPIADYNPYKDLEPFVDEVSQVTPDLTMAVKYETDWGHIRLSTILRNIKYKLNDDIDTFFGYGASLSGIYKKDRNALQFQAVGGKGISAYLTTLVGQGYDGYSSIGNDFKATPAFGGWISYEYFFTEKLHANTVFGYTHYDLKNMSRFIFTDENETMSNYLEGSIVFVHYYGIINFMYDIYKRITIGMEVDYGVKDYDWDGYINSVYLNQDKNRDAMRVSFGFMYSF